MNVKKTYCGFISIVGRSNVGKSTLFNKLVRKKISITSHKMQTTQYCIFGVFTKNTYQAIYIDTPGFFEKKYRLVKNLTKKKLIVSVNDVELIIFVVESIFWKKDDELILKKLKEINVPVILALNKVDNLKKKNRLLPHIQFLSSKMNFLSIIPISSKIGINIDAIQDIVFKNLPEETHFCPENQVHSYSKKFIASEIIREKLMRFLDSELPYFTFVKIENFCANKQGGYTIVGLILVNRVRRKKIVIGNKGIKIKTISEKARIDMQKFFEVPIHLKLLVKVKSEF